MEKLNIIDLSGKTVGEFVPNLKEVKASSQVLFDQIIAETAGRRQGTHSTLTKAEVRGGGRKPVPQKHTGNARQGSIRNPHYVGGGVAFGPKPNRNYKLKVNKKVSQAALAMALNQNTKNFIIIDDAACQKAKTKDFAKLLKVLKIYGQRILFVLCAKDTKAIKATKNIAKAQTKFAKQVSAYDVLVAKKIILCASAAKDLLGGKK